MQLTTSRGLGFRELVFSDLPRYRPGTTPSWTALLLRCLSNPGLLASVVLRAQQVCVRAGHERTAHLLRTLGMFLVGADFVPGVDVGPGLLMPHPSGVVLGNGARVGRGVTLGGGVTMGLRRPEETDRGYPVVCDGATVLTHAVLVGPVVVGAHAQVGANAVVTRDVDPYAVVVGAPARPVGSRRPDLPEAPATD